MSQPQIIITGLGSTYDDYGLIITDKSIFPEAEIKEHLIDVPGRNGPLDLSESVQGDIAYADVVNTLVFESCDASDVTDIRRKFVNALSGRLVDYVCSWDPDYTLRGRWKFGDAERVGESWCRFTVLARTDPYKLKETCTYRVNAAGGVTINLACGRKRVCPTIEVNHRALVSMDGRTWVLEPGASRIRDLWLSGDTNIITIDTYPEYCVTYWTDYTGKTWADFAGKRWSEVGSGSEPLQEGSPWSDYAGKTWADLVGRRWVELMHPADLADEYAAYIQFDWSDL